MIKIDDGKFNANGMLINVVMRLHLLLPERP